MTSEDYAAIANKGAYQQDNEDQVRKAEDAIAKPVSYWDEKTGVMNADAPGVDAADAKASEFAAQKRAQAALAAPVTRPADRNAGDWQNGAAGTGAAYVGGQKQGEAYGGKVIEAVTPTATAPGRTVLYFGDSANAPIARQIAKEQVADVAKPATVAANVFTGANADANNQYQQSMVESLQRQGYRGRQQNGMRNDAIVTDAFAALYNQWKNTDAGADGKGRVGLVREALRAVNDQLASGRASYRVLGMSAVGSKDGDPVFRIVTVDRNGGHHVMTRSLDDIYGVRLKAMNGLYGNAGGEGGGAANGQANGQARPMTALEAAAPSAIESRVIDQFGDRRGVRQRYDMLNAENAEKIKASEAERMERERANRAREELAQKQIDESRRATDEKNKVAAMELIAQYEKANGGKQITEREYMTKVLTDPKLVERYRTVPAFERDENGNVKLDPKTQKPIPKMTMDEYANEVQATENLSDAEVYNRIRNEYRNIVGGSDGAGGTGGTGGARVTNPLLEILYKEHPDWRPVHEPDPEKVSADDARAILAERKRKAAQAAAPLGKDEHIPTTKSNYVITEPNYISALKSDAKEKAEWEDRMADLFKKQRERRERDESARRSAAEKARAEKRDAEKAAFMANNLNRLQKLYESGDVDAIRKEAMRSNESWSDADVEETTKMLESLFM